MIGPRTRTAMRGAAAARVAGGGGEDPAQGHAGGASMAFGRSVADITGRIPRRGTLGAPLRPLTRTIAEK